MTCSSRSLGNFALADAQPAGASSLRGRSAGRPHFCSAMCCVLMPAGQRSMGRTCGVRMLRVCRMSAAACAARCRRPVGLSGPILKHGSQHWCAEGAARRQHGWLPYAKDRVCWGC